MRICTIALLQRNQLIALLFTSLPPSPPWEVCSSDTIPELYPAPSCSSGMNSLSRLSHWRSSSAECLRVRRRALLLGDDWLTCLAGASCCSRRQLFLPRVQSFARWPHRP